MEFNPANHVIQLCIQGMELEEKGKPEEAGSIFLQAWNESTNDFEKFTSAYYLQIGDLLTAGGSLDGPFSNNTTFNNAWYYAPISPNNPVIELPR